MSKWTPGEWWVGYSESGAVVAVVNESGDRYFVAHINEGYPNAEQSEANARLIAAAPEMAELLASLAQIDRSDGNRGNELARAEFLRTHPEFIGYAKSARSLLARIDK